MLKYKILILTSLIEFEESLSVRVREWQRNFWGIFGLGVWGIFLLVLTIRNVVRPSDLADIGVYLAGARYWIEGTALYGYKQNTGFVYSPFAAICYTPLTLLPPIVARTLWQVFSAGILLTGLAGLCKYGPFPHITRRSLAVAFVLLLPLSAHNFVECQSNALVIGLIMIAVTAVSLERWMLAAIAIAGAVYWKIYPIVVAMLLVLIAPTKITWRLFFAFLAMALIPFVCQNSSYVLEQYQLWYTTRIQDNRLNYPLKIAPLDLWYLLVRRAGMPISETAYQILRICSGAAIAWFCILGRLRGWQRERILGGMFSFVCAWILLFGPASENETYLLLAPAVVLGVLESLSRPSPVISRSLILSAYLLLFLSMAIRQAFFPSLRLSFFLTLQPIAALCFLGYALLHYCWPSKQVLAFPLWGTGKLTSKGYEGSTLSKEEIG